jgi:hypothetical protein
MTMPTYGELGESTPGETAWTLCLVCKNPERWVPANEAAAYGGRHEDCRMGFAQPTSGERPRLTGSRSSGRHVIRKSTNQH